MLDPATIRTDPAAYQFRSGGDENGVTAGRRFTQDSWNENSDPLLVHQRLNGDLYVADGHHRLDLANRTNALGTGPGKVSAVVLREADGYSVEDVKIIAGYKNMQRDLSHGNHRTDDLLDGAHLFKEARTYRPEWLPSLQMDNSDLHMSYSLSNLSERSLDVVAQGRVNARTAAAIAESVHDSSQQDAVIQIIANDASSAYKTSLSMQGREIPTSSFEPSSLPPEPARQRPNRTALPQDAYWQRYLAQRQAEVLAR